jgi:hypothetical protein
MYQFMKKFFVGIDLKKFGRTRRWRSWAGSGWGRAGWSRPSIRRAGPATITTTTTTTPSSSCRVLQVHKQAHVTPTTHIHRTRHDTTHTRTRTTRHTPHASHSEVPQGPTCTTTLCSGGTGHWTTTSPAAIGPRSSGPTASRSRPSSPRPPNKVPWPIY